MKLSILFSGFLALIAFALCIPQHSVFAAISTAYTTKIGPTASSGEQQGAAIATGDVNHDGYKDTIVGAYNYSTHTGRVYIYYGSSSGISTTPDITITGAASNDYFGYSVASGDVNHDGYDDVAVGAYNYSGGAGNGRVYVYYGGASMDTTADVTLTGVSASDFFGYAVSVGDVNNDTYADILVGAYGYTSLTGRAYIFYGGASMDTTADVTMTGAAVQDYFGYAVSVVGDVNNDGYKDAVIGSYNSTHVYVYYGGASMDNTVDVTLTGPGNYAEHFGSALTSAGDINNDGYDDILVGSLGYNSNTGRAYVYYGGASMDTTADVTITGGGFSYTLGSAVALGDINNDGYDDVIIGADGYSSNSGRVYVYYGGVSMDTTIDATLDGDTSFSEFGGYQTPLAVGDINGDTYTDLIIGSPGSDSGNYDGAVFVYINDAVVPSSSSPSTTSSGGGHDQGSEPEDANYAKIFFHASDILQPTQVTTPNRPIQIKVKITRRDLTHITLLIGRKYYTLYDDGKHGDAKKGDHIFASNPVTFTHSMAYTIKPTYHTITVPVKGKVTVKK